MSTRTPYDHRLPIEATHSIYTTPDPVDYAPAFVFLLARHGTRWPTSKRMRQVDGLERVFRNVTNLTDYPWAADWHSPYDAERHRAGDLHPVGERELAELGGRLAARFPGIFPPDGYAPATHSFRSTAKGRAAASATACGLGLFPGPQGGRPAAIALAQAPKADDPLLRFFDKCGNYKRHKRAAKQRLAGWQQSQWALSAPSVAERIGYRGTLTPCDLDSMWQLCEQEASMLGRTDGVCSMLSDAEIQRFEWVEDVSLSVIRGDNACENFLMAAPLIKDLTTRLTTAASDTPGVEKARLLFAHAETVVPVAAYLGLLGSRGADSCLLEPSQPTEDPLLVDAEEQLCHLGGEISSGGGADNIGCLDGVPVDPTFSAPDLPQDPLKRVWRGGRIAPFGANIAFVLYRRLESGHGASHLVRMLYNEQVVPVPGCASIGPDCALDDFLQLYGEGIPDWEDICGLPT